MELVIYLGIGLIFGFTFGWCSGYFSRPTPYRVWACARCDTDALTADETAVLATLDFDPDIPDDPRSTAA